MYKKYIYNLKEDCGFLQTSTIPCVRALLFACAACTCRKTQGRCWFDKAEAERRSCWLSFNPVSEVHQREQKWQHLDKTLVHRTAAATGSGAKTAGSSDSDFPSAHLPHRPAHFFFFFFEVNDDISSSCYWSVSSAFRGLLWDPSAPGTLRWHQLVIPSFPLARWPAKKLTRAGWSNSVRVCVLGGRKDFCFFFMSFVLINI